MDIGLTEDQLALLLDPNLRTDLRAGLVNGVAEAQSSGGPVIEGWGSQYAPVGRFNALVPGQAARVVNIEEVQTAGDFFDAVGLQMPLSLQTPTGQALARLILIRTLRADYTPNEAATQAEKAQARRAVSTIKANVMAGEAIVRANQQIGDDEVERLEAYMEDRRNRGMLESEGFDLSTMFGSFLLAATLFAIYGLIVLLFRPSVYRDFRWLSLHALLVAAFFGISMVIGRQGFAPQLLPVAFVALTVAVLWDGRLALALAAILAVLAGSLPPFAGGQVLTTTLIAGAAAALSVRVVRRRSQFWIFVGIITAAYAVTELSLGLIQGTPGSAILLDIGWGAVSATASALAAAGFLSLFEWYTGITTDQTLLEWADPNRPLLGRLSREAPGTYAHTIGVANLSEAAAGAIGANGLLCRVGAYYHDVGKMVKPQYFIENQPSGRNPHDKLKPATSAAIVREHVTEGLRMAREERVPEVICDFIAEHHGTHEIGFFFQKALEEADDPDALDARAFSYPGPRPRSKETAILMMADSLESATRALKDPSPDRITDLVESVIDSKVDAGQLDDAPLTLSEIRKIKEQLKKVLSGMYHQRIDYPSTKHLTEAPHQRSHRTTRRRPSPHRASPHRASPHRASPHRAKSRRAKSRRGHRVRSRWTLRAKSRFGRSATYLIGRRCWPHRSEARLGTDLSGFSAQGLLVIQISVNHAERMGVPVALIERAVRLTLDRAAVQSSEVSVTFLPDRDIRALNAKYLNHDWATDVLSFPLEPDPGADGLAVLGDIYIGAERARVQATERSITPMGEAVRLAVHGTLHLLGHDHPEVDRESSPFFDEQEILVDQVMAGWKP